MDAASEQAARRALELFEQRQFDQAARALAPLCDQHPSDSRLWHLLGQCYYQRSQYRRAGECFNHLCRLNPDNPKAHYACALAAAAAGQLSGARASLERALALDSSAVAARVRLAQVLIHLGHHHGALEHLEMLLQRDPDHPEALNLYGDAHLELGQLERAESAYKRRLAAEGTDAGAALGLATVMLRRRDIESARALVAPLLEAGVSHPRLPLLAAELYQSRGEAKQAVQVLQQALAHPALAGADRAMYLFALGKVLDATGDYSPAFEAYREANTLISPAFDSAATGEAFRQLRHSFGELPAPQDTGARYQPLGFTPIFIVGMPRSGTSLTEQILASHSDVHGGGERQEMAAIIGAIEQTHGSYPGAAGALSGAEIDRLRAQYGDSLRAERDGDQRWIIDKMPDNFKHLGLIARLFPEAVIIHCRRNPLDTCLSCFFQSFSGAHEYAYNLTHLGEYYRHYQQLMDHWRDIGLGYLDLDYEALVADPEPHIRRLLGHCQLPWQDQCLSFHTSGRVVTTASYDQASQPLYQHAVERWRHYRPHIRKLVHALGLD